MDKPEALRHAQELDRRGLLEEAAELRRLHAENQELLEVLKELVEIVEDAISQRSAKDLDSFTLQPARAAIAKATEEPK